MKSSLCKYWCYPISEEISYGIEIKSESLDISNETVAMAHWFSEEPNAGILDPTSSSFNAVFPIKTVYLDRAGQGWIGEVIPPHKAKYLAICIYHWYQIAPGAMEENYQVSLENRPHPVARQVKLAVAHQKCETPATWEKNMTLCIQAIRQAAQQGVNLLCLTEMFLSRQVPDSKFSLACEMDSPRLKPIYDAVREAGIYVVFSYPEKYGKKVYNAAVLVSPTGAVIGSYRKTHLTFCELLEGMSSGLGFPVFETPIGRIGMLICWDSWFSETAYNLAKQNADIICFPVAGDGITSHWQHVWPARAMDNQVYWMASVTANSGGEAPSQIIAPSGEVMAQTNDPNSLAIADIKIPFRIDIESLSVSDSGYGEWRNVMKNSRRSDR